MRTRTVAPPIPRVRLDAVNTAAAVRYACEEYGYLLEKDGKRFLKDFAQMIMAEGYFPR